MYSGCNKLQRVVSMIKKIEVWSIPDNKLVKSITIRFKAIELEEIKEMCRQCSVDKKFYRYELIN